MAFSPLRSKKATGALCVNGKGFGLLDGSVPVALAPGLVANPG